MCCLFCPSANGQTFYSSWMRTKTCYSGTSIIEDNYFNEVPREWGNLFVKSRIHHIEHLHLTNFPEKYQNVRYIEVKLIINLQNPAFPHLKNYCTELYKATAPGTQETKLLKTSVHINFILIYFSILVSSSNAPSL